MLAPNILQIRDESTSGLVFHEMQLRFESEVVTIKEIIEQRVKDEVEKYAENASQDTKGLITPSIKERFLNNKKIKGKAKKQVDTEKQIEIALKAFENNGFFMLVDDQQVDSLDNVVTIKEKTMISFIKLTQLVGG